ncbi:uncharacterized protein [Watersipora subatra]|uniref:uncharacterized protein n=1 Tax=Watersipora subatra TaxID=2589382 RepID=UPI00355B64C7
MLYLRSSNSLLWLCCILFLVSLLIGVVPVNTQLPEPVYSTEDDVDDRDVACAACLAIVDIVENEMTKKSFDGVESRLYDLLESICDQNNYRSYEFIPPKMMEGCKKIMDRIEEDTLVAAFQLFYSKGDKPRNRNLIERKICLNVSGDCIGNKRLEGKDKPKKAGSETTNEDKHFDASVEEIMAKHGHKVKKPSPMKHNDEL